MSDVFITLFNVVGLILLVAVLRHGFPTVMKVIFNRKDQE